ncbi:MAG: hypothetical protein FWH27_12870 [Planctomycetaceae bacterium]|nr:hypothetical protein [Planctomycetaceae bacterium]
MKNRHLLLFFVAIFAATLVLPTAIRAQDQTLIETFQTADGTTYFAVGLQAEQLPADMQPEAYEIAIIVDTSGTQTGKFRTTSLDAARLAIDSLPENAGVRLFKSDVETEALTNDFVSVKDAAAVAQALQLLNETTPLGACDFMTALQGAVEAFDQDSPATQVVLMIGSGNSDANLKDLEDNLGDAVLAFQAKQIPVNFLAIGNNVDFVRLGQIAYQTGGWVIPESELGSDQAGSILASVLTATVFWVTDAPGWFDDSVDCFPKAMPPIRSDRETFFIGKTDAELPNAAIQLVLETKELADGLCSWDVTPKPSETGNAFLATLVEDAATDEGFSLTLAGRGYFDLEKNFYLASLLANPATDLAAQDRAGQRELLDDMGLEKSFFDARTETLSSGEQAQRKVALKQSIIEDVYPVVAADKPFVDKVGDTLSMLDTQMTKEVNVALAQADKIMKTDPQGAQQIVENTKQLVKQTGGLSADSRQKMIGRLENKARQASHQAYINELKFQEQQTKLAAIQERMLAENRLAQDSARLRVVMERFTALMRARDYLNAKQMAESVIPIAANTTAPILGSLAAEWNHTLSTYDRLRDLRDRAMVGVTLSIHETNVVLPDNTPLVYPDPEVWALLTEYRKEHYEVMSLVSQTKKEEKIYKSLDLETDVNVEDVTFGELLDKWKTEFGIDIFVDTKSFENVDIIYDPRDKEITMNVSGVLFRNAMNLALRQMDEETSYIIRDEVLTIVPKEIADKTLEIRAYPVGDLVMQISSGGGMMGGMMGGMGGGMMGGMGGMGGYGGGMGGMGGYGGSSRGGYGGSSYGGSSRGGYGGRSYNLPTNSYDSLLRYNYYLNMQQRGLLYSPNDDGRSYSIIDDEAQRMIVPQKKTTR